MKPKLVFAIALLFFVSCQNNEKSTENVNIVKTDAEKIADANGIENWNQVERIAFTFNVDRDSGHSERKWIWEPKTNSVVLMRAGDTTSYNRNQLDSITMRTDRGFINDKFWLLFPFQLVWDEGTTISETVKTKSPVKGEELNKFTIRYGLDVGYTPGDAYDVYFDDSYFIKEWGYIPASSDEPRLVNTFENYQEIEGIWFATEHKRSTDSWNLNFTGIRIDKGQ